MTRPPIPRDPEEVTARWMQQALAAGGASDLPPVKEIAWEEIGSGVGFMGTILRCQLRYAEPRTPAEGNGWAPATVIVKLPSPLAANRRLSKRLGLHKRGYDFYRLIASQAPVRSPALLYGDYEAGSDRFVLVLEDFGDCQSSCRILGVERAGW